MIENHCYSSLWFIASQKKKKRKRKKSTSNLSLFCILFFKMTNYVSLYSSIWKSVNLIYSSNGGFMAMNNMLRALIFLFFKWRKHFFGSVDLVEFCWRDYKFNIRSFLVCVWNFMYRRNLFWWWGEDFTASGFHMKPLPHCCAYASTELGVKNPALPLCNDVAVLLLLSNGVAFPLPLSNDVVVPLLLSSGVAFPHHIIFLVSGRE